MSSISSFATKLPDLPPPDDEILVANNLPLPIVQPMNIPAQNAVGNQNSTSGRSFGNEEFQNRVLQEINNRRGTSDVVPGTSNRGNSQPAPVSTPSTGAAITPTNSTSPAAGASTQNTGTVNNRNAPVVNGNNALKGRDPDLIFAGDKIKLSNGEIYTAKSTDTLSGIASKTGNSLDSLMKQNGFDSQLLGKNANGKYFDLNKEQQRVQQMPVAPGGSVNSSQGNNTSAVSQSTSGATQQLDAASSALKKLQEGVPGIKGEDLTKLVQLVTKLVANLQDSKNPALSTEDSKDLGILVEKYRKPLEAVGAVAPAPAGSSTPNADPEPAKSEPTAVPGLGPVDKNTVG